MTYPANPQHHETIKKRMDKIDRLLPEHRALVHEHGWTIIDAFLTCGVTKPRHIQHLIRMVREGSYNGGRNPAAAGQQPRKEEE